jgi:hypothetical protein
MDGCDYRRVVWWLIYCTLWYSAWLHITCHYYTHTHTSVHSHVFTNVAFGSGLQRRTFPFLCVSELSPASQLQISKSNSSQRPNRSSSITDCNKSKVNVTTHGRGVKHTSGAKTRQLRVCWCGAPSLTRGQVCRLQLLLALASAVILGSESYGTHDHILLPLIRDSTKLEEQDPYLYPPRPGWPSYTPRHWVPFSSPPKTRRATVKVFELASKRGWLQQLTGPAYNISARTA